MMRLRIGDFGLRIVFALVAALAVGVGFCGALYGRPSVPAPESSADVSPRAENDNIALKNATDWRDAEPGYELSFPQDHRSHPEYGLEWWYYTGNLEATNGRRFGYQLTFFRIGLVNKPDNPSRWAVRDLFMTHFAISDIASEEYHSFERLNRSGIDWAGASADGYRVWNEDWQAMLDGSDHVLTASDSDCRVELRLTSDKPPVIHGENGISQKGSSRGYASHYYSLTRLNTSGALTLQGEKFAVSGTSWMDHEFGTHFLDSAQVGWDWFSIQLEDGRELMLLQIRRRDGTVDPHSNGTLVDANGHTTHISSDELVLKPGSIWRSDASGASYPTSWFVELPHYGLLLNIHAAMSNQEFLTEGAGAPYWEGAVDIKGSSNGSEARGQGYLEMTGYAGQSMGSIMSGAGAR
jgi:predicted secreted hydrolase